MEKQAGQKLIGLTGMYCAGKNFVAALLEKRGLPVLDVDKLGHAALDAGRTEVLARFGPGVLGDDGKINRRALGEAVFGKEAELAALEAIVHPAVNRMTEAWVAEQGRGSCVINAALIHKSSVFNRLDRIILVEAPLLTRVFRARKRDGLSWAGLVKRFGSQKNFRSQYLPGKADIYRVENRGSFPLCARFSREKLENRIDEILSGEGMVH
ncbi:MAG: dephospho-CoA kinase [Treponema sp.]|jgi:dephospho-CoA kinase|nr:dephospho-CoA kinase [Treponema sp.]